MSESNNNRLQSTQALLTNELFSYCQSESISEEGIREIIERHRLTHNNNHVNNYGFFHAACKNNRFTMEIIQCLLEYFPEAAGDTNENGVVPLQFACCNKNVTLNIIQLLIDSAPDSVRSVDNDSWTPLHVLCDNHRLYEMVAIEILIVLIEKHPEAVRHADNQGRLPIRIASRMRSPEFCRVLIEAYPGSERIADVSHGRLPLHWACAKGSLATIEYLLGLFPEAIDTTTAGGQYPIHAAIQGVKCRNKPAVAAKVVQCLLDCDPNQKLKQFRGLPLLYFACALEYNDSTIHTALDVIRILFDAHPEAIENNRIASEIHLCHQQVQAFVNSQLVYARQAKDHRLMTTPDTDGQLPLHRALENNVRLGSIKLLINGNPAAVKSPDNSGALSSHIACQHHDSTIVVQYLRSLDTAAFNAVDIDNNTILHYACRGAKHDTIMMLLKEYDAASVSKRNAHGKLPIDLLWESNEVSKESVEYTGSVFQLVRAYPEMTMINNTT